MKMGVICAHQISQEPSAGVPCLYHDCAFGGKCRTEEIGVWVSAPGKFKNDGPPRS